MQSSPKPFSYGAIMRHSVRGSFILMSVLVAGACSESALPGPAPAGPPPPGTQPPGTQTFTPSFISAASDAPAIANPVVSFYAKKGVDAEAFMYYRPRPGRTDSTVFVRFRVGKNALFTRPGGGAIAAGDSVLITITLADPVHLVIDMQPAGLRFTPTEPAELKLSYLEADDDLNHDGRVDAADTALESALAIWRREGSTSPWTKLASIVQIGTHEIEALVTGFTSYAVAY